MTWQDRAVSTVLGFVLIFGIIVITFSAYQAQVVPEQNSEIEFQHSQDTRSQMVDLRSSIVSMPEKQSLQATTVNLGLRYPPRAPFINPPPVTGKLMTDGTDNSNINITIQNATAIAAEGETDDFWNGTALTYNTGVIEHSIDYNEYNRGLPIVYEHSVIHNQIDNGEQSVPLTQQSMIQGTQISLISINGSFRETGTGVSSIGLEPLSTQTRVVEINNTDGPITIEFASRMSASVWQEIFTTQRGSNGQIKNISGRDRPGEFSVIELTLEPNQRYTLELIKIGVGSETAETSPAYLTDVTSTNSPIQRDSARRLIVETRDKFNVPQSGVKVRADPDGGSFIGETTSITGSEGRATFLYTPNKIGTHQVNFTIKKGYTIDSTHNGSTAKNVSMSIVVKPSSGGDEGNGSSSYTVDWFDNEDSSSKDPQNNNAVTYNESAEQYNYDASQASELDLTMFTSPTVDNATVEYAVSDRSIANLSVTTGTTNSVGENVTTLQPRSNGLVRVYTSSGGSGDEIRFNITGISGNILAEDSTVVYKANGGDKNITAIEANGSAVQTIVPSGNKIDVIGQIGTNLDSDRLPELSYIQNGNLKIVDTKGNKQTIVNNSSDSSPNSDKTTIFTGKFNDSEPSIFYADSGKNNIFRVNSNDTPIKIATPSNGVSSIIDTGNIDGDNRTELLFLDGSQQVRYLNQDGSITKLENGGIGSNNGVGVGESIQINGTTYVSLVSGNNNIKLVTNDGGNQKTTISGTNPRKASVTSADVDTDGTDEIVYVGNDGNIQYVDDPLGSETISELQDSNGDDIKIRKETGVVSG